MERCCQAEAARFGLWLWPAIGECGSLSRGSEQRALDFEPIRDGCQMPSELEMVRRVVRTYPLRGRRWASGERLRAARARKNSMESARRAPNDPVAVLVLDGLTRLGWIRVVCDRAWGLRSPCGCECVAIRRSAKKEGVHDVSEHIRAGNSDETAALTRWPGCL